MPKQNRRPRPAIQVPVPDLLALQKTCEQLKEAVEIMQGQRGKDSLDMVVRWGDLVQLGLIQETDVPGVGNPHVNLLPRNLPV